MLSTRVILSLKIEWNFGTWKYTSSMKKEFVQRLLGNTFSFPEYLEPPSSTLFVKLPWKPYVRLGKSLKPDTVMPKSICGKYMLS